jgi:RNA polymerase sigma-70 factor (ECF subfamily)
VRTAPRDPELRLVDRPADERSLDAIYRRYGRYVAAVILRLGGRTAELEDLIQEVFLEAARGIGSLRDPAAAKGWLATIAVRTVQRRLRIRRARRFFGLDAGSDDSSYENLVDPGASPHDKALIATVFRLLDDMPVADRIAFSLRHVHGESLEAVAEMCGCSLATANRRIARTLQTLEKRMADE